MNREADEGTRAFIVLSGGTFVRNTLSVRITRPTRGALVVVVAGGGHTAVHFANPACGAVGVNGTDTATGDTLPPLTHPVPGTFSVSTAGIGRTNTYSVWGIHRVPTVGIGGTATVGIVIEDAVVSGEALSVGGGGATKHDRETNQRARTFIVFSWGTFVRNALSVRITRPANGTLVVVIAGGGDTDTQQTVPPCGAVAWVGTRTTWGYTLVPLAQPACGTVSVSTAGFSHASTDTRRHVLCCAALKIRTATVGIATDDTTTGGEALSVRGGDATCHDWETNEGTRTGIVVSEGTFVRNALSVRITGPALGALRAGGAGRRHTEAPWLTRPVWRTMGVIFTNTYRRHTFLALAQPIPWAIIVNVAG